MKCCEYFPDALYSMYETTSSLFLNKYTNQLQNVVLYLAYSQKSNIVLQLLITMLLLVTLEVMFCISLHANVSVSYLVISLTKELQPLSPFVHEDTVQVASLH